MRKSIRPVVLIAAVTTGLAALAPTAANAAEPTATAWTPPALVSIDAVSGGTAQDSLHWSTPETSPTVSFTSPIAGEYRVAPVSGGASWCTGTIEAGASARCDVTLPAGKATGVSVFVTGADGAPGYGGALVDVAAKPKPLEATAYTGWGLTVVNLKGTPGAQYLIEHDGTQTRVESDDTGHAAAVLQNGSVGALVVVQQVTPVLGERTEIVTKGLQ